MTFGVNGMAVSVRQRALTLNGWRFAPRFLPTLATLILLPTLIALGFWQLDRADQKRALLASFAAHRHELPIHGVPLQADIPSLRFRRVSASGHFDNAHSIFLDNRIHDGMAGFELFTPLRLAGGHGVLIDRGWAPLGRSRADLPRVAVRAGTVTVAGLIDKPPVPGLRLGRADAASGRWPHVVEYVDLESLARELGYPLLPVVILENRTRDSGLVRPWMQAGWHPVIGFGPRRHLSYAVQWFGLALALLVIYVAVNTHRAEKADG